MLFAWSLSGFIVPAIGTALTAVYGTQSFMYVAIAIAAAVRCLRRLACRVGAPRPVRGGASRR